MGWIFLTDLTTKKFYQNPTLKSLSFGQATRLVLINSKNISSTLLTKKRAGVVNLKNYMLYLIPPGETANKIYPIGQN